MTKPVLSNPGITLEMARSEIIDTLVLNCMYATDDDVKPTEAEAIADLIRRLKTVIDILEDVLDHSSRLLQE